MRKLKMDGDEYTLTLTTKATKKIAGRYGGLENLGEKLMKSENFEMAIGEIVELLTVPADLATYKGAIIEALYRGTKRNVENESDAKKRGSRVTDAELFTRLLYCGMAHLHMTQEEVWLTPFGLLLDLRECHKQYNGIARPKREVFIDDIIPDGI